ncbi:MAG: ribbon-helix-helix protein, CopG family [Desulfobacterales bacterium]|nr:ribbon-helix-helix protein, CopG family [Desulfobacterales bacterium]
MAKMVISFKIDEKIKAALQKLAEDENRSLSNYVTTLLLEHLKSKNIDWHKVKGKPKK